MLQHDSATRYRVYDAVALRHKRAKMPLRGAGKPLGETKVAKPKSRPDPANASSEPSRRGLRPGVVHSSLYLPEGVYEALRETAFHERCKIHDLVMQGIDLALRKRGYPSIDDLKVGKKR